MTWRERREDKHPRAESGGITIAGPSNEPDRNRLKSKATAAFQKTPPLRDFDSLFAAAISILQLLLVHADS
jgi:hypothetical protein